MLRRMFRWLLSDDTLEKKGCSLLSRVFLSFTLSLTFLKYLSYIAITPLQYHD